MSYSKSELHLEDWLLSWHQIKTLKKAGATGREWIPAHLLRVSQKTWDSLITLGFIEEKREGETANQRFLRLTEKGRRAADGGRY
jgi:hypothetical protein